MDDVRVLDVRPVVRIRRPQHGANHCLERLADVSRPVDLELGFLSRDVFGQIPECRLSLLRVSFSPDGLTPALQRPARDPVLVACRLVASDCRLEYSLGCSVGSVWNCFGRRSGHLGLELVQQRRRQSEGTSDWAPAAWSPRAVSSRLAGPYRGPLSPDARAFDRAACPDSTRSGSLVILATAGAGWTLPQRARLRARQPPRTARHPSPPFGWLGVGLVCVIPTWDRLGQRLPSGGLRPMCSASASLRQLPRSPRSGSGLAGP